MSDVDLVKQLVEMSLSSGRNFQSPQTGFVHYCYFKGDEALDHTIPTYENALFALSLLRMKTAETIKEGKGLLSRLLKFQGEEGNFPVYLHTYPECPSRFQAAHLLPVAYWVLKEYSTVVGKEFLAELEGAVEKMVGWLLTQQDSPFYIDIKFAAALVGLGGWYGNDEWKKEGEKRLAALKAQSQEADFGTWFSPTYIGETLIALQMVPEMEWEHFWEYLKKTWYQSCGTYVGPPVKVFQTLSEPEPTLYDLFLGEFTGGYPYHAFDVRPFQLQGALVHDLPFPLTLPPLPIRHEGAVAGQKFLCNQTASYAYSLIEAPWVLPPELKKGFHHFRLVWGDRNQIHSMSLQGGGISSFSFEEVEGGVDLRILLAEDPDFSSREKSNEILFSVDQHEALELLIGGQKATTFRLGEVVTVHSSIEFTLEIRLEEGDGTFMGHIALGNRPAQTELKGENRFAAYDKTLFLRTVRRYTPCKILAKIRFV